MGSKISRENIAARKDEIIEMYKDGDTADEIGVEIGVSGQAILNNLRKWGIDIDSWRRRGRPRRVDNIDIPELKSNLLRVFYNNQTFDVKNVADAMEELRLRGCVTTVMQILNSIKFHAEESISRFGYHVTRITQNQTSITLNQAPTEILRQYDMPTEDIEEALKTYYEGTYKPRVKRASVASSIKKILEREGVSFDEIKNLL